MQLMCERSNVGNDVRCTVCGQGFLVYWERTPSWRRAEVKRRVLAALREQHRGEAGGHDAHRAKQFTVVAAAAEALYGEVPPAEAEHRARRGEAVRSCCVTGLPERRRLGGLSASELREVSDEGDCAARVRWTVEAEV